jgi:hypothetical protein
LKHNCQSNQIICSKSDIQSNQNREKRNRFSVKSNQTRFEL